VTKRLTCCKPARRDPFSADEGGRKPADDRARRVPVARNGHRRPQRFGVVAEVSREGPEAKRNSVRTHRLEAGAHLQSHSQWMVVARNPRDPLDRLAGGAIRCGCEHGFEERLGLSPAARGPTGGGGDGHRAGLSIGMCMRDDRRTNCLADETVLVIGEIGPKWCDAHRRSVAHRSETAECRRCRGPPVQPTAHLLEDLNRPRPVATGRIGGETSEERVGEAILLDALVAPQDIHDGDRHLGVVGRFPARHRKPPSVDGFLIQEETLAERIPDRQTREARVRSFEAIGVGVGDGGRVMSAAVGFTIFRAEELPFVPRDADDPRTVARLSDALAESRANVWRYPPGAQGKRHRDLAQEEVFVILDGTLTVDLGEPPQRHEVGRGGVLVVERGTILQLRNAGDDELVMFIYGAPPEQGRGEFFDPVP